MLAALLLTSALAADHTVALSANKLRFPGVDVEYEHKVHDKMALGGFVGMGRYTPLLVEMARAEATGKQNLPKALKAPASVGQLPKAQLKYLPPLSYRALGMRYHWMPFGSFEQGIFVGASARWMYLTASARHKRTVTEAKSGASTVVKQAANFYLHSVMLGPHVGYKWTVGPGFTLSALLGSGYTYAKGKGVARTSTQGVPVDQKVTITSVGPYPFGTLLAGWTF